MEKKSQILIAIEFLSNILKNSQIDLAGKYQISPIQLQILYYMKRHNDSATLTELVKEYGLSKATLSDSLKTLYKKKFILKKENPNDARSSILLINRKHANLSKLFKESDRINESILSIKNEKQEKILVSLLELLSSLESDSIISERRMCLNCNYYRIYNDYSFYCSFLEKTFNNYHLKSDCEDFKSKEV